MKLAPICLFTYNRLAETQQTVEALKDNFLAPQSTLYIFSDGPKNAGASKKVAEVRNYVATVDGFEQVRLILSEENKGLAASIIQGVSTVVADYGKVIVVEDDLVTAPNFLDFMNQALHYYEDDERVLSVSGYTMDLPSLPGNTDYYFGCRASSWGWATWQNRWSEIDWEVSDFEQFNSNAQAQRQFNRGGSDMTRMLRNQMKGKIDSWAIRFCYHQFKNRQVTVFPSRSKLINIGFGPQATHTSHTQRFRTPIDTTQNRSFSFQPFTALNEAMVSEFAAKFSIYARARDKANRFLSKLFP